MNSKISLPILIVALCLLIVPFCYSSHLLDPALWIKYLVMGGLSILLGIALFSQVPEAKVRISIPIIILIALAIWSFISGFGAQVPSLAFSSAIKWAFLASVLFLFQWLRQQQALQFHWLEKALVLLASLVAIVAVVSYVRVLGQGEEYNHQTSYLVTATFAHRNLLSQVLLFVGIMQFLGQSRFSKFWNYLSVVNLLIILKMVVTLYVRSVWLAGIAALVLTLVFFLIVYAKDKEFRRGIGSFVVIILAISGVIYLWMSGLESDNLVKQQSHFISNSAYGSSLERMQLWENSWELFKQKPLLGVGAGNWPIAIAETEMNEMRSSDGYLFFQRAHNEFVQALAEIGLLGTLLLTLLLLFPIVSYIKLFRKEKKTEYAVLIIFNVTFVIIAFFSFPMERMTHLLLLLFSWSFLPTRAVSPYFGKPTIAFAILIPLASTYVFAQKFFGEKSIKSALGFKYSGNSAAVIETLHNYHNYWLQMDNTATPVAWYLGSAYFEIGEMEKANEEFASAYSLNPNHAHVLNNYGSSLVNMGEIKTAKELYVKAQRLAPKFSDPFINLAAVFYNNGQLDSAIFQLMAVDTNSSHELYTLYVETIATAIIDDELTDASKEMSWALVGIKSDKNWLWGVFKNAIKEGSEFRSRLRKEVDFIRKTDED